MQALLWIAGLAVGALALDRLFLWMEAQGWLYWRKVKRPPGAVADAILSSGAIFDPGTRAMLEARQERALADEDNGDGDGDGDSDGPDGPAPRLPR